ncbi:aspartate 1-decarboxylase [Thermoanaerobacter mathranii subsp. mathranii str. A3]|uniref:Aspartate 1-decarboxylase n=1 Tax=Thermoanaerobacter mathranii subsp. mathranii (strain DSM 11426 / CCUG 53645 / CIP 108742 / A3) TaxID=583358 RepID=A0ABN3Z270_THEM3|nr:aspartate 1-decarboxylase [Thermoanaerobacter mathranii]ADH60291.1 aspartate 1-decarboxylase [Thermoanaerobacter mathranii subsp. mathranii str. A3]
MQRFMMKSKIHRAIVTETNLNYQGSITIDKDLMELADILPNEKVQVLNINNGARFDTYAVESKRGSGTICINGAAARLCQVGDTIIIISYAIIDDEEAKNYKPKVIFVDENNKPVNM